MEKRRLKISQRNDKEIVNLPDDTKISKLLRRLNKEEDEDNSLFISKKLLEVLLYPENALYIREVFHILRESMLEILKIAPGPLAKCQAARALGRMGYILGQENDFERFQTWLFSKEHFFSDNLVYLYMKALQEILCFEKKKPVLAKYSASLLKCIVETIVSTQNIDIFKLGLEDLVNLIELYPDDFYPFFEDTVELLIGWHVDHMQHLPNIEFISKCMQKMYRYFQMNVDFSVMWILNFMEAIQSYGYYLSRHEGSTVDQLTLFILALNTVLKCVVDAFNPNKQITVRFITNCSIIIITIINQALDLFVNDNLIIASNDCISILLTVPFMKQASLNNSILSLVDLELALISEFSNATIISLMILISKVIKELSANLPIELIHKLLGPSSQIIKLRQSLHTDVQEATLHVYQSLLDIQNISLLQEAYRYILGDLELVYRYVLPDIQPLCQNNPFKEVFCTENNVENTILFLLRCLSQVANVRGSIIETETSVLKPSMLQLLGILLEPYNRKLSKMYPTLQYSLLYLLFSHCKCCNYFISSSSLVNDKLSNSSNFVLVLNVLHNTLITEPSEEAVLLLLHWVQDILVYSEPYLKIFYQTREFQKLANISLIFPKVKTLF